MTEKPPSLWHIKVHAYFWTIAFGAVFFIFFFVLFPQVNVDFAGLDSTVIRTSLVWVGVIVCTVAFNKIYYHLNPDVYQNQTDEIRKTHQLIKNISTNIERMSTSIQQINDVVITYADKMPSEPEHNPLEAET